MPVSLTWLLTGLAGWFVLSLSLGLLVGRMLGAANRIRSVRPPRRTSDAVGFHFSQRN